MRTCCNSCPGVAHAGYPSCVSSALFFLRYLIYETQNEMQNVTTAVMMPAIMPELSSFFGAGTVIVIFFGGGLGGGGGVPEPEPEPEQPDGKIHAHVAAESVPALHVGVRKRKYPLLHVGLHDEPLASELVQLPTPPLVGAVDASHGFGLHVAEVSFLSRQDDVPASV